MDGELFPYQETTDPKLLAIMDGKVCRKCAHRIKVYQGADQHVKVTVCEAQKSGRTKSGLLKVKANQPACILFKNKTTEK